MANKINYLTGSAISSFGDGCQQIAMMWLVYHLTGSPLSIGVTIAIYYLPSVFLTPFLSVFVDQRDSKVLTVATDAFRFVLVSLISILLYMGWESVYLLYLLQFFLAVGYTLYKPASKSFIKESFNDKDLAFVFAKSTSLNEMTYIAGVALAGFMVSFSPALCFILNALSFAFPVVLFGFVKRLDKKIVTHDKIHYLSGIKEGFTFIKSTNGMAFLFFLSILNSIAIQMATTLFLPLAKQLNGGSELYSSFEMAFSIGVIIAGLVVTYLMKKLNRQLLLVTISGMLAVSVLMAWSSRPVTTIILIFGFGYFVASHLIATQTIIQLRSPKEMIGRVFGLRAIMASIVKITSALATGFLITEIPISDILYLFGLVMLISLISSIRMGLKEIG